MFFTVTQRATVNEATKTSSCHQSAISTTIYSRSCNFIFSTSYSLSNSVRQQTADLMTNSRGSTEDTESWKSNSQNLCDRPGFKFSTKSQNFPCSRRDFLKARFCLHVQTQAEHIQMSFRRFLFSVFVQTTELTNIIGPCHVGAVSA